MPRCIGCDVHKREAQIAILQENGAWAEPVRLPCTREALTAFARQHLQPDDRLALEATFHTWALVELLRPFVGEVVVSNPLRTKAIASAKIKTDKVDARVLAELLRSDFLPRVWQPDPETQRRRRLVSRRASLVGDRTKIKNRLHAVLHHRLIPAAVPDLFNPPGRRWLAARELDPPGRAALDSELRLLDAVEAEIRASDDQLATLAWHDPQLKLLMTLPGVDFGIACTLLAAFGDITRFRDGQHAASYLGLVPSTRQSGDHCYHGPITRHGNPHPRWLLVQAAQHLAAHPGPLGVFFRRLLKKKNRNVAVVACARKLVVIAWHMLSRNEPYRYAQPLALQAKLTRLRTRVTRQRRSGGLPKGAPRPANYGHGRTRRVPSLAEACTREALPPPFPPAPGEQRMLADQHLTRFARRLHTSYRVPKGPPHNPRQNTGLPATEKIS
jgi:transposase